MSWFGGGERSSATATPVVQVPPTFQMETATGK
jgi:hypothetical protein